MRINIVGSSGSGKSTFGRKLAGAMGAPYQELDALHWLPDWQEKHDEQFFADIERFCAGECWVLDGNYNRSQPVKWARVDTVIWLDYSRALTFWRSLTRALKRSLSGQELWPGTGNRETLRKTFFSRDSVLWWSISNYDRIRRRYADIMADPTYGHIEFIRIKNPAQAAGLIDQLQQRMARSG